MGKKGQGRRMAGWPKPESERENVVSCKDDQTKQKMCAIRLLVTGVKISAV